MRISCLIITVLWVLCGCTSNQHEASNTAENHPKQSEIVVEKHDTILVAKAETVNVEGKMKITYSGDIDNDYVERLYMRAYKGSFKAYEKLNYYLTNRKHPFPTMPLSIYMAHSKKYPRAYYYCFKALCYPYQALEQRGTHRYMDRETKMLALYFLTRGANMGDEKCISMLNGEYTDTLSIECQVSRFYIENGKKDVILQSY